MSDTINQDAQWDKWNQKYQQYEQYRDYEIHAHEKEEMDKATERSALLKQMPELQGHEMRYGYYDPAGQVQNEPILKAHMDLALERAEAQISNGPVLPDNETLTQRFPGVDPLGKHSIIGMKFAQRAAQIEMTIASRPPEVQGYYNALKQEVGKSSFAFNASLRMKGADKQHKIYDRASKLSLDPLSSEMLHTQMKSLETDVAVEQYDKLLQGLEYAAGVRKGPLPKEIGKFYTKKLGVTPPSNTHLMEAQRNPIPLATLNIDFPNFDNQALQMVASDPKNWGKSADDLKGLSVQENRLDAAMARYVTATANRALTPLFESEKTPVPIENTILIDGKSAKERLLSEGVDLNDRKTVQAMTSRMVACALMTDRHVEAFMCTRTQAYPNVPTQITKTGFQPDPMDKVSMNRWERFWNKHGGFFQEKADKTATYNRIMEGRAEFLKDVQHSNFKPYSKEESVPMQQLGQMARGNKEVVSKLEFQKELGNSIIFGSKAQFYGDLKANPLPPDANGLRSGRSAEVTYCISLLAKAGHSPSDIFDSTKLLEEKKAVGQIYRESMEIAQDGALDTPEAREQYKHLLREEDKTPEILGDGDSMRKAVLAQMGRDRVLATKTFIDSFSQELKAEGFDFTDPAKLDAKAPYLRAAALVLVDNDQEFEKVSKNLSREEYKEITKLSDPLINAQSALDLIGNKIPDAKLNMASGIESQVKEAMAMNAIEGTLTKNLQETLTNTDSLTNCMSMLHSGGMAFGTTQTPTFQAMAEKLEATPGAMVKAGFKTAEGKPLFTIDADLSKRAPGITVNMKAPEKAKTAPDGPAKATPQAPKAKGR